MNEENNRFVGLTKSENYRALENLQEIHRFPSISPVNLNYFGSEECEPGHSFGPFARTSYLLHMVRAGKGCLVKKGRTYEICAGQAFLIWPGEEVTYQADSRDPWSYMWIGFHGLQAEEMTARAGFTQESPVLTCRSMEQITETMERLLDATELTYVNELLRTGYTYQLFALLTQDHEGTAVRSPAAENSEAAYVKAAVNLLINSKEHRIRISEVARTIGVSRGYLTSIFRKEMNLSPQEFLMNFRLEKACNLLQSTNNSIGMIAEEVGYADVLSFSKSFRRRFGISPSRYREQKVMIVKGEKKGDYTSRYPL